MRLERQGENVKRQIRRGAFETNSSSSHAIVLLKENADKNGYYDNWYLDNDGVWKIWDSHLEFGRSPFDCLNTFKEKVCYAIASLCYGHEQEEKDERINEITAIVMEMIPECKGIELPKEYNYITDTDQTYYGYVDENILSGFLEVMDISLKEFLVNENYIVIVDGDEYCIYDKMKKCGAIDKDNIVGEHYGFHYDWYKEWEGKI